MKTQLIKISETHYIVVDDTEIKEYPLYGDNKCFIFHLPSKSILLCNGFGEMNGNKTIIYAEPMHKREVLYKECKRITHSFGVKLEGVINKPLSEVEEAIYGYSVEKMAQGELIPESYIKGFNTHKELIKDKLFTIEDMKKSYMQGFKVNIYLSDYKTDEMFDEFIQSLLPPTEWNIEFDEQGKIKLL